MPVRLLDQKRALITGGSRNLGRAIVTAFARHGAQVAFTYLRDDEAARETVTKLAELGLQVTAHRVPAHDAAATADLVEQLESTLGGVDLLVNNAGSIHAFPLALLEQGDLTRLLEANCVGAFVTSREVVRGMIRRRSGAILNISSIAAQRILDAPIDYAMSKAAVDGLTRSLAREVGRYGIRVNGLAPGILEGGISLALPQRRRDETIANSSLQRLGTLEEIAELAAFLVSDDNSCMTGETVVADGGL